MLTPTGGAWNLFLLSIPSGIALYLKTSSRFQQGFFKLPLLHQVYWLALTTVFLLFFPNIPYIFTDSRHLLDVCTSVDDPLKRCFGAQWAIPVYFTYGTLAIPFFVLTIRNFSRHISTLFSASAGLITPIILIPLSALGVLLGLNQRHNSWEFFLHPLQIWTDGLQYLTEPDLLILWLIYCLCFTLIYLLFSFFLLFHKI